MRKIQKIIVLGVTIWGFAVAHAGVPTTPQEAREHFDNNYSHGANPPADCEKTLPTNWNFESVKAAWLDVCYRYNEKKKDEQDPVVGAKDPWLLGAEGWDSRTSTDKPLYDNYPSTIEFAKKLRAEREEYRQLLRQAAKNKVTNVYCTQSASIDLESIEHGSVGSPFYVPRLSRESELLEAGKNSLNTCYNRKRVGTVLKPKDRFAGVADVELAEKDFPKKRGSCASAIAEMLASDFYPGTPNIFPEALPANTDRLQYLLEKLAREDKTGRFGPFPSYDKNAPSNSLKLTYKSASAGDAIEYAIDIAGGSAALTIDRLPETWDQKFGKPAKAGGQVVPPGRTKYKFGTDEFGKKRESACVMKDMEMHDMQADRAKKELPTCKMDVSKCIALLCESEAHKPPIPRLTNHQDYFGAEARQPSYLKECERGLIRAGNVPEAARNQPKPVPGGLVPLPEAVGAY